MNDLAKNGTIYKNHDTHCSFLLKNKEVLFDLDDLHVVMSTTWFLHTGGYAYGNVKGSYKRDAITGKRTTKVCLLHREILNPPKNLHVDHINGNPLDNRKANLRVCTQSQNSANSRLRSDNRYGVKGIYFDKVKNRFLVRVTFKRKLHIIGGFKTLSEAIKARLIAEDRIHGEFARKHNV